MMEYKPCTRCGRPATEIHHIYNGAYRKKSEIYGAVIPLCRECHDYYHFDGEGRKEYDKLKAVFQRKIMKEHGLTEDEFREIFRRSYL